MATGPRQLSPEQRLKQLEDIENEIGLCLQNAGLALQELAKEKPIVSNVSGHTSNFVKSLQGIENGMAMQITYLLQSSAGTAHEGSSYGPQKDLHMAIHRMQHVRSKLDELDQKRADHLKKRQPNTPGQQQSQGQGQIQAQGQGQMQVQGQGQMQVQGQSPMQVQGQSPMQVQGQAQMIQNQSHIQGHGQGPMQGQMQVQGQMQGQVQGQMQGQAQSHMQTQGQGQVPPMSKSYSLPEQR